MKILKHGGMPVISDLMSSQLFAYISQVLLLCGFFAISDSLSTSQEVLFAGIAILCIFMAIIVINAIVAKCSVAYQGSIIEKITSSLIAMCQRGHYLGFWVIGFYSIFAAGMI